MGSVSCSQSEIFLIVLFLGFFNYDGGRIKVSSNFSAFDGSGLQRETGYHLITLSDNARLLLKKKNKKKNKKNKINKNHQFCFLLSISTGNSSLCLKHRKHPYTIHR